MPSGARLDLGSLLPLVVQSIGRVFAAGGMCRLGMAQAIVNATWDLDWSCLIQIGEPYRPLALWISFGSYLDTALKRYMSFGCVFGCLIFLCDGAFSNSDLFRIYASGMFSIRMSCWIIVSASISGLAAFECHLDMHFQVKCHLDIFRILFGYYLDMYCSFGYFSDPIWICECHFGYFSDPIWIMDVGAFGAVDPFGCDFGSL